MVRASNEQVFWVQHNQVPARNHESACTMPRTVSATPCSIDTHVATDLFGRNTLSARRQRPAREFCSSGQCVA